MKEMSYYLKKSLNILNFKKINFTSNLSSSSSFILKEEILPEPF